MKTIQGDLIQLAKEGRFDVVIHGCNCFSKMGAGIASQIKEAFPDAWRADWLSPLKPKEKLGRTTSSTIPIWSDGKLVGTFIVVNAYTQYRYGKGCQVDYEAVASCFRIIKRTHHTDRYTVKFGIPKIGAGLAGGNWNVIQQIIEEEMNGTDLTLVVK